MASDDSPQLVAPQVSTLLTARSVVPPMPLWAAILPYVPASPEGGQPPRPHGFAATYAPSASLPALYQRWIC